MQCPESGEQWSKQEPYRSNSPCQKPKPSGAEDESLIAKLVCGLIGDCTLWCMRIWSGDVEVYSSLLRVTEFPRFSLSEEHRNSVLNSRRDHLPSHFKVETPLVIKFIAFLSVSGETNRRHLKIFPACPLCTVCSCVQYPLLCYIPVSLRDQLGFESMQPNGTALRNAQQLSTLESHSLDTKHSREVEHLDAYLTSPVKKSRI